jgi:hypothetical protein
MSDPDEEVTLKCDFYAEFGPYKYRCVRDAHPNTIPHDLEVSK